jgi:putative transcriptional regulator
MKSLQGRLLIAAPSLSDPNFARTVILIAAHGEGGALGLILNRGLDSDVCDVWGKLSQEPCVRREKIRHGGPVPGSLMVLHDLLPLADIVIADDLYVATELASMESLAASTEGRALFFVGHSGWGPGQLEAELEEGSWLLAPASPEHVFDDRDHSLWKEAATLAGRREIHALVDPRHVPEDPRAN